MKQLRHILPLIIMSLIAVGCNNDPGESEVPNSIQRNTDFDGVPEGLDP